MTAAKGISGLPSILRKYRHLSVCPYHLQEQGCGRSYPYSDRLRFFRFELYEVIAGFDSEDLCDDCIHAGEVIVLAAHEEIHIHRRSALEVCQCIDEQAALEHEVFRAFGACQPAQEFLLKEQLQALLTGCEERLAAAKAAYDTRLAEYIAAENAYNPVVNKAAACQTARMKYSAQRLFLVRRQGNEHSP